MMCRNISKFCVFVHSSTIPIAIVSLVQILMFVLAVVVHGRQVEWTARLDFLWQIQATEEKREMDTLQHSNKRILFNLLPAHVATHFLDNQFRSNMVCRYRKQKKNLLAFMFVNFIITLLILNEFRRQFHFN